MIDDFSRIRALRQARQAALLCGLVCFLALASPWRLAGDLILGIFTVHFILRALDYASRIRQHELDLDVALRRERGATTKQL